MNKPERIGRTGIDAIARGITEPLHRNEVHALAEALLCIARERREEEDAIASLQSNGQKNTAPHS